MKIFATFLFESITCTFYTPALLYISLLRGKMRIGNERWWMRSSPFPLPLSLSLPLTRSRRRVKNRSSCRYIETPIRKRWMEFRIDFVPKSKSSFNDTLISFRITPSRWNLFIIHGASNVRGSLLPLKLRYIRTLNLPSLSVSYPNSLKCNR